ncbi:hypothetical protein Dsin_024667 [Dipteronia sinensis]|uniref:Reverse transcriptase n=1 Tax=Dipteronia sinensis TaxID=43782 RepID=A0AAD9ZUE6_9ROSI|nr:hypothetical protein Dsin_024667 [Dipteronia sinensis]
MYRMHKQQPQGFLQAAAAHSLKVLQTLFANDGNHAHFVHGLLHWFAQRMAAACYFLPLVERCWREQVHGTMLYKLCSRIRNLNKALKTLNNDKPLDSNLRMRDKELISCYTSTLKAEEDLLRQKSRIQWLKAGDRNSFYLFKAINGKRNRSKIHSITGDDGSLIECDMLVKNEAIHHFQTILGWSMPVRHGIGSTFSNIIDKVISNDQADLIGREVTNEEIHEVCFSLHPNKAPGLDGFNAHCFKIT